MNKLNNKKAFTIIELIVVIAVLGILVLMGLPRLLGHTSKAQVVRIQHDTKIMQDKMEEVLSDKKTEFAEWDNNAKDLGTLIMKKQLYEIQGRATSVDKSHINFPVYDWASKDGQANLIGYENTDREINLFADMDSNLGVGGPDENVEGFGYKIIPDKYKGEIKTRLDGTFYSNSKGKVYYEPNKPIKVTEEQTVPNCIVASALDYEFEHTTGTIIKYKGVEQYLVIPESFLVEDKCWPVLIIGRGAFQRGEYPRDLPIKEVILPPSLQEIEEDAFEGNEIENIIIPSGVTDVGNNAFNNNGVKSDGVIIQRPSGSVNVGSGAFGTTNPIYRPNTDKSSGLIIKPNIGSNGNIITSTGVDGVERPTGSISATSKPSSGSSPNNGSNGSNGGATGSTQDKPKTIVIPDVVIVNGTEVEIVEVDQGAFQGEGLIHVTMPSGLQRIEDYAFAGNQLIGVSIPDKINHIGNYAFAYNEVTYKDNYKWTIEYIKFQKDSQVNQADKVNKVGDIEINGKKAVTFFGASLLDNIFLMSNNGYSFPEDYNPGITPPLSITINPGYIDTNSSITFGYEFGDEILNQEWDLNGKISNIAPNGKLLIGNYNIKLRVMDKNGKWSKWVNKNFVVKEYVAHLMNKPGNNVIEDISYDLGDNLVFNYTNSANLNWTVPISGTYLIKASGAGAGGKGALAQGVAEINQGDIVNLKIHIKDNGGGKGGTKAYQANQDGSPGSGGTILKLNNKVIIAAAGAGGRGGNGSGYHVSGVGGAGGNGGDKEGLKGLNGTESRYIDNYDGKRASGGTGGAFSNMIAKGGNGGGSYGNYYGSPGSNGSSTYDGAGGGGAGGRGSYWPGGAGGGGAGGKSFIDETVINATVTPGSNAGNGSVIITLIKAN